MQPYAFPYIGYFQLLQAVDTFVFYDDVNFIKQGWVNRNRILVNGSEFLFTIPLEQISSYTEIRDTQLHKKGYGLWKNKFCKTLSQSYKKAAYYNAVMPMILEIIHSDLDTIAELAQMSITTISRYLKLDTSFEISSQRFADSKGLDKADRLIHISKKLSASNYINFIGGEELYSKEYFSQRGIQLDFIRPSADIRYTQFENRDFVPWLSIIDVMMFNSPEQICEMLKRCKFS